MIKIFFLPACAKHKTDGYILSWKKVAEKC